MLLIFEKLKKYHFAFKILDNQTLLEKSTFTDLHLGCCFLRTYLWFVIEVWLLCMYLWSEHSICKNTCIKDKNLHEIMHKTCKSQFHWFLPNHFCTSFSTFLLLFKCISLYLNNIHWSNFCSNFCKKRRKFELVADFFFSDSFQFFCLLQSYGSLKVVNLVNLRELTSNIF